MVAIQRFPGCFTTGYINRISGYLRLVAFELVMILYLPVFSLPAITDDDWTPMHLCALPGAPGVVDGPINAIAWRNGILYIGGDFRTIENIEALHIAQWDGRGWSPVGKGLEQNQVDALCFDKRGILYAGVTDVFAPSAGTWHPVIRWDGHEWDSVGQRIPGYINALICDDQNNLYAGGGFNGYTYDGIAKWNGSDWSKMDSGLGEVVNCLALDTSGTLYAGGYFKNGSVSRWDGEKWHALGRGIKSDYLGVNAIAFDTGGTLYVGGNFDTAGTVKADNIAQWDGAEWKEVGGGVNNIVGALISDGRGGVFAGGQFSMAGNTESSTLVKWDGQQWNDYFGRVNHLSAWALGSDDAGNIYASMPILSAEGNVLANGPIIFDGNTYSGIGPGTYGSVTALTHDDNGNLYFAGKFSEIPGDTVNRNIVRIMKWDGTAYQLLGTVKSSNLQDSLYQSSAVNSLAFGKDGRLYAGGNFNHINDVNANGLAFWDGVQWNGFGDAVEGLVVSISTFGENSLIMCGTISIAKKYPPVQAALFDGSTWRSIDLKMPGNIRFGACATDARNTTYMANYSDSMRRVTEQSLTYWNGTQMQSIEPGIPNGKIYSLACDGKGNLYVGGQFDTAGNIAAANIAKWDGERWYPLGTGVNNGVYALECDRHGNLYAGGWFDTAGGAFADHIARWDGNGWSAFGTGVNKKVTSLELFDTVLYVGGEFDSAGSVYSPFLVKADLHISSGTVPAEHTVSPKPFDIRLSGDQLTITNGSAANKVTIYSIEGRQLYESSGTTRVSLARFAQRIIIVRSVQNGKTVFKKCCLYRH